MYMQSVIHLYSVYIELSLSLLMLLYKKIDLPRWESIQSELVRAVKWDKVSGHNGFIPFENLTTPLLDCTLRDLNLLIESRWIIAFRGCYTTILHTDYSESRILKTSLNLPVYNCVQSRTEFYQQSKNHDEVTLRSRGVQYFEHTLVEDLYLDQFTLDQPTLINTSVPHRVVNQGPETRVAVSIRFAREPLELWGSI